MNLSQVAAKESEVSMQLLTFQNFQGFKGNQHAPFAPITLIFGPNASGKSSIARAMRVFKQTVGFDEQTFDVNQVWDGSSIKMRNKEKIVFGQLKSETSPDVLGLGFTFSLDNDARWPGVISVSTFFSESVADSDVYLSFFSINIDPDEFRIYGDVPSQITFALGPDQKLDYVRPTGMENMLLSHLLTTGIVGGGLWLDARQGAPVGWEGNWLDLLSAQAPGTWDNQIHWGEFNSPDSYVEKALDLPADMASAFSYVASLAAHLGHVSKKWFQALDHVEPLRPRPEDLLTSDEMLQQFKGSEVDAITNQLNSVNDWLLRLTENRFQIQAKILVDDQNLPILAQLTILDLFTNTTLEFGEVGTGIGHVFPILQHLATGSGSLFVEEPELHLHPKMQADLMDIFIESFISDKSRQFFIETHSESMLLRLQKRIRDGRLSASDVSVLYVDAVTDDDGNRFNSISQFEMDSVGDLLDPFPESFAGLRIQDLL